MLRSINTLLRLWRPVIHSGKQFFWCNSPFLIFCRRGFSGVLILFNDSSEWGLENWWKKCSVFLKVHLLRKALHAQLCLPHQSDLPQIRPVGFLFYSFYSLNCHMWLKWVVGQRTLSFFTHSFHVKRICFLQETVTQHYKLISTINCWWQGVIKLDTLWAIRLEVVIKRSLSISHCRSAPWSEIQLWPGRCSLTDTSGWPFPS